jgi:hypothetical protein
MGSTGSIEYQYRSMTGLAAEWGVESDYCHTGEMLSPLASPVKECLFTGVGQTGTLVRKKPTGTFAADADSGTQRDQASEFGARLR